MNLGNLVKSGKMADCSKKHQFDEVGKLCYHETHESSSTTSMSDSSEASTKSSESVYEEATSSLLDEVLESQEPSSNCIVLDPDSSTVKEKEGKEDDTAQHIKVIVKSPEAQSMSRLDYTTENHVHGETSFSAVVAPPASITYVGPYGHHPGNISLRSESSAGSSRSFAFPVLQAEWNCSPVRMAKAEQRNFHKLRRWFHSLLCWRC